MLAPVTTVGQDTCFSPTLHTFPLPHVTCTWNFIVLLLLSGGQYDGMSFVQHELYAVTGQYRGFASMLDEPLKHAGSDCLPIATHGGVKIHSSHEVIARPMKGS